VDSHAQARWDPRGTICPPSGANIRQTIDITKQKLTKYPQIRHVTATFIIEQALTEAWPCKNIKKKTAA
jgi:hypothetical protein